VATRTPVIQDIFRQYGKQYLQKFGAKIPALHKKTLWAIINCRTKDLGGEVWFCGKCKEYHYSYHSCGNRHCVVCQNDDAAGWTTKSKANLLPLTYFLATFTLPEALRKICRSNQKRLYSILFKASSDTLKLLAKDEKYLGAEIGFIGILHSWTRAMMYHPHVHYLIPGGGISNDGKRICFSHDDFLMHVKALSIIFKAKFRDQLKQQDPQLFNKIQPATWQKPWVVHIKPVGDGEKALEYIGRYLFRVAISNNRILKVENGNVTFRYTDYKSGKSKIVSLDALEFIRRFLQHVLPHNFMKVRYYGFLAAASRKKLAKLKKLLFVDELNTAETPARQADVKMLLCPLCGSQLTWIRSLTVGDGHDP
jgi:hypothetical protein